MSNLTEACGHRAGRPRHPVACDVMGHGTAIIGAVGEHLAREHLQEAGWHVSDEDFRGGNTKHLDLIATSPDGSITLEIQVKATTTDHAGINCQKPGRAHVSAAGCIALLSTCARVWGSDSPPAICDCPSGRP
jgi:hypothetical protein